MFTEGYESWQGLVYQRAYTESRFSQDALAEDAGYEMAGILLFRTVGIDRSFFRPANAAQLARYAKQVPEDFRFCFKVWEEITIPGLCKSSPLRSVTSGGTDAPDLTVVMVGRPRWSNPDKSALVRR